jgi:hypothetical protein
MTQFDLGSFVLFIPHVYHRFLGLLDPVVWGYLLWCASGCDRLAGIVDHAFDKAGSIDLILTEEGVEVVGTVARLVVSEDGILHQLFNHHVEFCDVFGVEGKPLRGCPCRESVVHPLVQIGRDAPLLFEEFQFLTGGER